MKVLGFAVLAAISHGTVNSSMYMALFEFEMKCSQAKHSSYARDSVKRDLGLGVSLNHRGSLFLSFAQVMQYKE